MRGSAAILIGILLQGGSATAAPRHDWRILKSDPDFKFQICYPADLLRAPRKKLRFIGVDLKGAGNATVLLWARRDNLSSVQGEYEHALASLEGGPAYLQTAKNSKYILVNEPTYKVTRKEIGKAGFSYSAETKDRVVYEWLVHVDGAYKRMWVEYSKAHAAAWKGVPERMRSCFKSLGPITNPNIL